MCYEVGELYLFVYLLLYSVTCSVIRSIVNNIIVFLPFKTPYDSSSDNLERAATNITAKVPTKTPPLPFRYGIRHVSDSSDSSSNNSHHAPSTFPSSQLVFLSCTHSQLRAVVMIFKIIGLMLGKKIYSIAIETPIVFGLCIVRLIIDIAHHICSRNPPAVVFVIPDSHHLAVINMYILFTHN